MVNSSRPLKPSLPSSGAAGLVRPVDICRVNESRARDGFEERAELAVPAELCGDLARKDARMVRVVAQLAVGEGDAGGQEGRRVGEEAERARRIGAAAGQNEFRTAQSLASSGKGLPSP